MKANVLAKRTEYAFGSCCVVAMMDPLFALVCEERRTPALLVRLQAVLLGAIA
jgi:hypothetical protein